MILTQIKAAVKTNKRIDHISFSGSGEPTLNSKIGYLIKAIKKFTTIPVAVITNGSLLFRRDVQKELLPADVVLPTFDAATQKTLNRVNRPHSALTVGRIAKGLIEFRKKFTGQIWLEIMLAKGINDSKRELKKLKQIVDKIQPDTIHLNTVVRPPVERFALPLARKQLLQVKKIFGKNCQIVAEFTKTKARSRDFDIADSILNIVSRRPVTARDIARSLGRRQNEIRKQLSQLRRKNKIKAVTHHGRRYYEPV
jgi:wyosine [tRNA(Phe)-imidazoG37] synthetase (radical SAM superfamily)